MPHISSSTLKQPSNAAENVPMNQDFELTIGDLILHESLQKSRSTVYLASRSTIDDLFILKVYPYEVDNRLPTLYACEIISKNFDHPNIIKTIAYQELMIRKINKIKYRYASLSFELGKYGDLNKIIMDDHIAYDEKLFRTFFKQIIAGVNYLHKQNVAHLDLKPENIVLGKDYQLKIIDFEASYKEGDRRVLSRGTLNYRAPEIISEKCIDPYAADIFSLGVLVFTMMFGHLPFCEPKDNCPSYFYQQLQKNEKDFWAFHERQGKVQISKSFRQLFSLMVEKDPNNRITVDDIMQQRWYRGETYDQKELKEIIKENISLGYPEQYNKIQQNKEFHVGMSL